MAGISGVGANASVLYAQTQARPASAEPGQKADAPLSQRMGANKATREALRIQPQVSLPEKDEREPGLFSTGDPAQRLASTTRVLQERQATRGADGRAQVSDERQTPTQDAGAIHEKLQEKMQRQIVKMKEAYSHIQAHTGDTKAGAGMSLVV